MINYFLNLAVAYIQQEPLIAEMRKEIISLRSERDHLKKSFESAKTNVTSLKEVNFQIFFLHFLKYIDFTKIRMVRQAVIMNFCSAAIFIQ